MEYASKGVAGAGLGTGIAGLSLGVLNAMGGLAGLSGVARNETTPQWVSKEEFNMGQSLAAKDSEIAMLKAGAVMLAKICRALSTSADEILELK